MLRIKDSLNSIITNNMECCYKCGTSYNLQVHHCIHGNGKRKLSEKYGLKVMLCIHCHTGSNEAVHMNRENDLELIKIAQKAFEITYSREEFIKIFGRNYL